MELPPSFPLMPTPSLAHKIMIVEDDVDTRELIHEFLEHEGYAVDTYSNGREAISALSAGARPSIILLDWRMPVMSGKAFLEEVHALPDLVGDTPIYLFSAESDPRIFENTPCAGVIQKPIDFAKLLAILEA